MGFTRTSRRAIIYTISIVAGALILTYLLRVGWLTIWATEGDIPPASSLSLPAGSEILSDTHQCASGGCWSLFEVRPPDGSTQDQLAAQLGASPQACVLGSVLDPRTIRVYVEPKNDDLLLIRADYWTSACD